MGLLHLCHPSPGLLAHKLSAGHSHSSIHTRAPPFDKCRQYHLLSSTSPQPSDDMPRCKLCVGELRLESKGPFDRVHFYLFLPSAAQASFIIFPLLHATATATVRGFRRRGGGGRCTRRHQGKVISKRDFKKALKRSITSARPLQSLLFKRRHWGCSTCSCPSRDRGWTFRSWYLPSCNYPDPCLGGPY